jgi:dihydroorotate dehydrogenase (fumarate)
MANLKTTYMGLELKNPIILGACNLTFNLDTARSLEDAGIAAVVFKSLFEEQINLESLQMEEDLQEYNERNAEMVKLFPSLKHAGPAEHLEKLSQLKKALSIPVIGSLNCVNPATWVEYAVEMEKTGVDALELNFYSFPWDFGSDAGSLEDEQVKILEAVKKKVKIPVSVKLSPFYTNPLHLIHRMDKVGVDGFVLFNNLYQPEINIEEQELNFPFNLSQFGSYRLPLRYAGLLHKRINGSVCSNTGIFSGQDVVRLLLAGADAVQVVSTVYQNKAVHVTKMLNDITAWMKDKGYSSIDEFRGKVAKINSKDPYTFQRAQYVDMLMQPFEIMKKYPQV